MKSGVPKRGRSKRCRSQKHANERKRAQMQARKGRKRAQKGAKERERALPHKNCKLPGLQTTRFREHSMKSFDGLSHHSLGVAENYSENSFAHDLRRKMQFQEDLLFESTAEFRESLREWPFHSRSAFLLEIGVVCPKRGTDIDTRMSSPYLSGIVSGDSAAIRIRIRIVRCERHAERQKYKPPETKALFSSHFSLSVVRNQSRKRLNKGNFNAAFRVTMECCDSCAQGALGRRTVSRRYFCDAESQAKRYCETCYWTFLHQRGMLMLACTCTVPIPQNHGPEPWSAVPQNHGPEPPLFGNGLKEKWTLKWLQRGIVSRTADLQIKEPLTPASEPFLMQYEDFWNLQCTLGTLPGGLSKGKSSLQQRPPVWEERNISRWTFRIFSIFSARGSPRFREGRGGVGTLFIVQYERQLGVSRAEWGGSSGRDCRLWDLLRGRAHQQRPPVRAEDSHQGHILSGKRTTWTWAFWSVFPADIPDPNTGPRGQKVSSPSPGPQEHMFWFGSMI